MDGAAGVANGDGDAGSCSDPEGGGSRSSTPLPTANRKYVCLRSLVGAALSSSSGSREAMPPGARKVLDVGARLWVPVASDGSSGSDTDGGVGSPSSPASTLHKPLLRSPRRHGLHGGCRDAELQIQAQERPLQLHPRYNESHLQYIQCLRKSGRIEKLRGAMNKHTPPRANMWHDWVEDETSASSGNGASCSNNEMLYDPRVALQIHTRECPLQLHPLDYRSHLQVFEQAIQCSTPSMDEELAVTINSAKKELEYEKRQKTLDLIIEDREKKDLEDKKRKKVVEQMSNNVKDISVKSSKIVDCLKCLSSHVNQELVVVRDSREKEHIKDQERQKVVEQISSDVKDFAATSWVIAENLESLSSCADEILQIKIEEWAKRETEEKSQKEDANFLKECQTMLSDFVFFMLAFIPWVLHKKGRNIFYRVLLSYLLCQWIGSSRHGWLRVIRLGT